MTMRLDIVTNDAGELVRREHARDLGAGVVVAIYRLAKLAQMHDLTNQAFMRQLEQTHQMIAEYCLRAGTNVNVLFAHKAVFVAGQLLKGSRGTYDAAAELGEMFERFGGSDLSISRDVTREELLALAEQISICHRTGGQFRSPSPKIRLRPVTDAARLRGIDLEDLSPDQRIVRAYASAVVIMRRFFEDLNASKYILPRRIKRIAQSLVDLSDASTAAFLGVTEVRNANYDEAGRAANTAILAVSIARELTSDRTVLAQIAMAAMMHDVSRPRAMALAAAGGPAMPGMQGPTSLSEDQEDRLASGAAAVLTALGRVNEPSITRTVLTFEALWLRRQTWLGPVYWGARQPTLHASIIAIARRYNDLLTPEPGLAPPTPDYAVAVLANELTDPQDRSVLRMLVSALGLLPTGTVVQLVTGEVAEVVRGARGLGEKPVVRLLADPNNKAYAQPMEVDLAHDLRRAVLRVLSVDGWRKGLGQQPTSDIEEAYDPDAQRSAPPPAPAHAMPPPATHAAYEQQYASWGDETEPKETKDAKDAKSETSTSGASSEHHSSQSMPSMGSSPSAVAEAMGRMINDSLRPTAHVAPKDAERTVFQPGAPEEPARTSSRPRTAGPQATARGNLAATPLPHVLVYMLDHTLTGSVVFEGEGNGDTIYFVEGVPAKARLGEAVALLGDVLVDAGAMDKAAIEEAAAAAQRTQTLLGQYLVHKQLVSPEMLAWALESQLLQKIAHLANLAPEIEYSYYRDQDLLAKWAAETTLTHPLNPILGSVRNWNDRARVRATLNRIGKHPLVLHPDSDIATLALMTEEQTVLDAIRAESMPLSQLFKRNLADEEIVSSLIYALAVTRQFAFKGQKKRPMAARGARGRAAASNAPAASSGSVPAMASGSVSVSVATPAAASHSRPAMQGAQPASVPVAVAAARRPQIRPISQKNAVVKKQGTMVGLQPSAPPEARSSPPARPSEAPDPDDNAKTIAFVPGSSPLKDLLAKKGIGSARPAAHMRAAPPADLDPAMADAEAALEAMQSFRLAEAALQRNDVAAAEKLAEKAVQGDPSQADYVTLLAWIRALGGDPSVIEKAVGTMSKVLIEDPSNERALLYRGKLLVRTNRLHEALNDFSELLSANPHHREAANELRSVKQLLGQ